MTKIIIISGKQGSGKTTLANALEETLKNTMIVQQLRFAQCIYDMHDAVRRVGIDYGLTPMHPKDGPLLQYLGTDWGRANYGDDVWVNTVKARLRRFEQRRPPGVNKPYVVILSDCRFRNELDAFPDALSIRLECPPAIRKQRCEQWRENSQHVSETDLDLYSSQGKFSLRLCTKTLNKVDCLNRILPYLNETGC